MSFIDVLLGRPLASTEERAEKIGTLAGIPIFGLDALGSAAYGPEAALTVLIPLGILEVRYIVPLSATVIVLLTIVYFSYRQTIEAYPTGGGSYIVASQNLGILPGLLAGAALLVDYILVAAVGIAAGVGAVVSALPNLQRHTLALCLVILLMITIVNLRGVRETGVAFMIPTYVFVACLSVALIMGVWKTVVAGGHPIPVVPPPKLGSPQVAVTAWLLLRAFASGCTAMTGVEAVSNGVMAFREPKTKIARRTLTTIIAILIIFLAAIAYLCRSYQIGATPPGEPGYQSVLSQLISAVAGTGWFYYLSIGSILLVLALQANTAFADFPRVCRALAHDGFLPRAFANRGRRLVYSHGIYVLATLSALLLVAFSGITDRLIPLFAVGAFMAFTLSQAGMVAHWKRVGGPHARHSMMINGLGATATAITTMVMMVSKFTEGAWITLMVIPGFVILMRAVRQHYECVTRELATSSPLPIENLCPPLVVVPLEDWNKVTQKALRFALTLGPEIIAVQVSTEETSEDMRQRWRLLVQEPARRAGLPAPELVVISSPYRYVIAPIVNFILELEKKHPNRELSVVVPELVEKHWYEYFLHNQRGELLSALLLLKGNQRIVIVNVPWHVEA
ncbi:MAG: amino acid permease-associated region [Acidobacteriaceae bacterium]|nr:amino acid permease-associated region [Acidobacteriaceae bacterium]